MGGLQFRTDVGRQKHIHSASLLTIPYYVVHSIYAKKNTHKTLLLVGYHIVHSNDCFQPSDVNVLADTNGVGVSEGVETSVYSEARLDQTVSLYACIRCMYIHE